jgi:hypothetical protein
MAIKSAYELAMERLGQSKSPKLSIAQKNRLAELEKIYTAKIAEVEIDLNPKIAAAYAHGQQEEAAALDKTLRAEIQKLRGKLESEKEAVRKEGATT